MENLEVFVKVLDGCALNNRFWVFLSGLTNVAVELRVEDVWTGEEAFYSNSQGEGFRSVFDTQAFDCEMPVADITLSVSPSSIYFGDAQVDLQAVVRDNLNLPIEGLDVSFFSSVGFFETSDGVQSTGIVRTGAHGEALLSLHVRQEELVGLSSFGIGAFALYSGQTVEDEVTVSILQRVE